MRDPKDITINGKQLDDILKVHKKWLLNEKGGERANLRFADLRSANLRFADLRSADLRSADLSSADLRSANLRSADLRFADLSFADLSSANLRSADLSSADLSSANLSSADLSSADLSSADLSSADLSSAKNNEWAAALVTIVSDGDVIGWKKLKGELIAKLLIPAKAKRSNATGRKCRAEYAKVLEIWNGEESVKRGESGYEDGFFYVVGKTVKPSQPFDDNRWDECSTGIHFFITRLEAEKY